MVSTGCAASGQVTRVLECRFHPLQNGVNNSCPVYMTRFPRDTNKIVCVQPLRKLENATPILFLGLTRDGTLHPEEGFNVQNCYFSVKDIYVKDLI